MSKRRPRRSPQRCENCGDPLGDSEALVVTGVDTGRVHYVHRPSSPERAMCFRWGVNGAEKQHISLKSPPTYDPARYDVALAMGMGLDRSACEAVGVPWAAVMAARQARRAR
jgi:hypothetical protein